MMRLQVEKRASSVLAGTLFLLMLSMGCLVVSACGGAHHDDASSDKPKQVSALPQEPVSEAETDLPHVKATMGKHRFDLEVAVTELDRQRGLMFRDELPEGTGMLFPFDPPQPVSFWMKNTQIPLDMVFVSKNKVVSLADSVPPCAEDPCPHYRSGAPVDMVIELPAGTAQKIGLSEGKNIQVDWAEKPSAR